MSKDKKKLPDPAGNKAPSDYQAGKGTLAKTEVMAINKKHK